MSYLSEDEEEDEPMEGTPEPKPEPKPKRKISKEHHEKLMEGRRAKNAIKKEEKLKAREEEKAKRKAERPKKEVPQHVLGNLAKGRNALHLSLIHISEPTRPY